ncbi:hypothetical protein OG497_38055 [Streptomyces sp. NBC_01242]|uniref:hypothetical protein n=1 Tax=Streptomyces sp. NBC_01242 TaxID=2903795 RepID=UPI0022582363|nr:hypothetical protein [Streptomyces sp. NBC_01242]MCX4799664.1 hypothetical protein [Streptomyces sp. NBC_01242]
MSADQPPAAAPARRVAMGAGAIAAEIAAGDALVRMPARTCPNPPCHQQKMIQLLTGFWTCPTCG